MTHICQAYSTPYGRADIANISQYHVRDETHKNCLAILGFNILSSLLVGKEKGTRHLVHFFPFISLHLHSKGSNFRGSRHLSGHQATPKRSLLMLGVVATTSPVSVVSADTASVSASGSITEMFTTPGSLGEVFLIT